MGSSLLERLGLPSVGDAKQPTPAARPLTDADFPVDANGRKRADAAAKKKGQAINAEAAPPPGKGPQKGYIDKKIDKAVDDFIDDKEKKARQLNKDAMPTFELFEEMTPEREFAEDLERGIKNATEQVKFIKQTIEYAEKFGDKTALAPISEAAKNLKKVTDGVLGGLGKAAKVAKLGKEVVVFFQALQGFAAASESMSASQGESVAAWVKSLQSVWNAGKPFVDRLKDEVFTAALAGSEAAGALGATLAIVGAELFIGLKALEAGVNVVNAYFKRLHEATKEDRDGGVARPDPPQPPLPFSTRAETIASIKRHEEDKKRLTALREKNAKEQVAEESAKQLVERFNDQNFPKLYLGYRKKIKSLIYAVYLKTGGGGGGGSAESDWWDCLRPLDESTEEWPNDIEPRKDSISASEAKDEVVQFMNLGEPCKFFDAIYQHELKAFLAKQKK
jgi:hypothetical protein